jgi:methylmalonyl-CoA/ethylmalonyl-CoA epimerase
VACAEEAGLDVFGVSYARPEWMEAFIHPRDAHGTLIQLAQVAPGYPEPVEGETLESFLAGVDR